MASREFFTTKNITVHNINKEMNTDTLLKYKSIPSDVIVHDQIRDVFRLRSSAMGYLQESVCWMLLFVGYYFLFYVFITRSYNTLQICLFFCDLSLRNTNYLICFIFYISNILCILTILDSSSC